MAGTPNGRRLELKELPLEVVELGRTNVRRREITAGLDELAASIEQIGQQQPIIVQPKDGEYEVLVGQRRYLAMKKLGKSTILALVPTVPYSDTEAVVISLAENVQRKDLEAGDKAEAIAFLFDEFQNQAEVARRLGISEQTVRRWLGYRAVTGELKEMVRQNEIDLRSAIRIAERIPDQNRRVDMAKWLAEKQPPAPTRTRIFDAMVEYGDLPIETIVQRAEETKEILQIRFLLAAGYARNMRIAADEEHREPDEIARDVTIDWLEKRA